MKEFMVSKVLICVEARALGQPVGGADAEGERGEGAEGEQPPPAGRRHDDRRQQHLRARAERPEAVQQHHALPPLEKSMLSQWLFKIYTFFN